MKKLERITWPSCVSTQTTNYCCLPVSLQNPFYNTLKTLKLTCIGDKRMARYDGAFSRNGNAGTVELLEVLFNEIPMDIHGCFGVSHPRLWLHVILTTGGLHVLGIALKENSQSMGHAAVKGGRFGFD